METTRAERIKIGAFMLLCGIMICVFLGYVLSRFLNKEFDNYYTVFSESVIGLYKDAQVKLYGIDVGNVTEIAIDSSNLNQVIVRFRVNKGTPIKLGTRAVSSLTNAALAVVFALVLLPVFRRALTAAHFDS